MTHSREPARPSRLPSLKALRVFEVVGRHLNLYDAADEMSVTPSAMSHQIRLLEEDLGVELFVRKGRGLELTGRGAELLPLLSAIFSDLGSVISAFRRERGAGSVSIQMPASFATRWFLPNLAGFEQAHPGVDVKLLSHDEPPLAPADGLDCAIRFGRSNWPAYTEYALYPEELVLVCSPRLLAGAERLQLEDIGRYRLLGVQHQPDVWKSWQQNFGIKPRSDARLLVFPTRELAIRGAVENLGLALAGIVEVADDLRHGRLALALGEGNRFVSDTYFLAVHQARQRDPGVEALSAWIRKELAHHSGHTGSGFVPHPWLANDASMRPYVGS